MVSPLQSIVAGIRSPNPFQNIGQEIQGLQLGNQQKQLNEQMLQRNKMGMQQQQRQITREEGMRNAQYLNRLGKSLLNSDQTQWGQILTPHIPLLVQMGYNPEQLSGMTREQVQAVVQQTDAVLGPQQGASQFGAQETFKDERGNLYFGTQKRDPTTGKIESVLSPIGNAPPTPVGQVSVTGTYGLTADEKVNQVGAETTSRKRAETGVKIEEEKRLNQRTFKTYRTGMDNLVSTLGGTPGGPFAGAIPAVTTNQQLADSAVNIIRPLLKNIFREAGEGTFSQGDQELLDQLIPNRTQRREVQIANLQAIDSIVKAKLGIEDLPEGVTEEDIQFTMKKHGLTREQVLERLQ